MNPQITCYHRPAGDSPGRILPGYIRQNRNYPTLQGTKAISHVIAHSEFNRPCRFIDYTYTDFFQISPFQTGTFNGKLIFICCFRTKIHLDGVFSARKPGKEIRPDPMDVHCPEAGSVSSRMSRSMTIIVFPALINEPTAETLFEVGRPVVCTVKSAVAAQSGCTARIDNAPPNTSTSVAIIPTCIPPRSVHNSGTTGAVIVDGPLSCNSIETCKSLNI